MSTIRGRLIPGVIPGMIPGVGLIAAIWVGGCVDGPRMSSRTGGGPMARPVEHSRDLAAQARRDSEWMLERINRNDVAPPPQGGLVANPLVQIKWNDASPSNIRPQRRPPAPPLFESGPLFGESEESWPAEPMAPNRQARTPPSAPAEDPRFDAVGGRPATATTRPSTPPAERPRPEPVVSDLIRQKIVDLSKDLYHQASYADMPLRELMLIAATTLVSPDRGLVTEAIPGLTEHEQQMLAAFQDFFIELGEGLDGSREAEAVIDEAMITLQQAISRRPQLVLPTVALCTRVGGFGDYDSFDRYSFMAHSEQRLIVYVEVEGFTSEPNKAARWVTELSQELVIYSDRDGIPVWREDRQTAVDVSKNKRQDFFQRQIITLPKALSVGKYQLKVRVRDEKSGAETEEVIIFEMVADSKLAATQARH